MSELLIVPKIEDVIADLQEVDEHEMKGGNYMFHPGLAAEELTGR